MIICINKLHKYSTADMDEKEAETIEHLARAYNYLYQIDED